MLVFWSRKGFSVTSNWTILDLGFPSDWANWVFSPYLHGDDPGSALEFLMPRPCCWCFLDMLLSGCLSNSSVSRLFVSLSGNEVHVFSFSPPLFWGSFLFDERIRIHYSLLCSIHFDVSCRVSQWGVLTIDTGELDALSHVCCHC